MRKIDLTLVALIMLFSADFVHADIEAVTVTGKSVLLKDDNTWAYIETKQTDKRYAMLSVAHTRGNKNYCLLGLRLHNNLADYITSIVLKFSAHNHEDVRYDSVTKGFQHLKPTNESFKEITFSGIACDEIKYIRVHGADRCEIGELNKFSAEKGECLDLVTIEPSNKVVIFKRYHDEPVEPEMSDDSETDIQEDSIEVEDQEL